MIGTALGMVVERTWRWDLVLVPEGEPARVQLGSRSVGIELFLVEVKVPPTKEV